MRGAANILNGLKYKGKIDKAKITIIHRGAPDNKKIISGEDITEIKKDRFNCFSEGEETTIPNHRILEIVSEGKVLWRKRFAVKKS